MMTRLFGLVVASSLLPMNLLGAQEALPADAPPANAPAKPKVSVKLLEAGSAPRRKLRYTLKAGSKDVMVMTMKMDMAMQLDGKKMPATPTPAMQMTMTIDVTDADDEQFAYTFRMTDAKFVGDVNAPDNVKTIMENQLRQIVGLEGDAVVTNRGFGLSGAIRVPPDSPPNVQQMMKGLEKSMGEMCAPLPEEEVGVGGSWQVDQELNANGLSMKQTVVHTLQELSEDSFTSEIQVKQVAEKQTLKLPGLPAGASLELDAFDGKGQGKVKVLSHSAVPYSTVESSNTMISRASFGEQRQSITNDTKMTLEIKPGDPSDAAEPTK
jgi:hypothetical protein